MRRVYSLPYRRFMASSFAQLVIPLSGLALKPMESRRKDPRRVPYLGRQEGKKRTESSSRSVHRVAVIFDDESREWKSERGAPPTPHHRDPRGLGGGVWREHRNDSIRFGEGGGKGRGRRGRRSLGRLPWRFPGLPLSSLSRRRRRFSEEETVRLFLGAL